MKRMIASAGVVALGAVGVQAVAGTQGSASVDASKPWSVSAALRGFYDDNPGTQPDGPNKHGSFGYQVNPSVDLSLPLGQTSLNASYAYSLKYFETRPFGSADKYDQNHTFNAGLNHAFSERYQLSVSESFVIGQEPDAFRNENAPLSTLQRIPGNNIHNYGAITLSAQITSLFAVEVGYANSFYDYADSFSFDPFVNGKNYDPATGGVLPSLSGLLDRIEHRGHIDGRWQVLPDTVGVVGYAYSQADYQANEPIAGDFFTPFTWTMSNVRNSRSHYGYVGGEHSFRQDLSGSVRAGVRYSDYYNDPAKTTDFSPYAQASLRYAYTTDSFATLGFTYDRNATDRLSFDPNNSPTRDVQSALVFGSLNHRITPNLYGNVTGQFQNSTLNGGALDGKSERYYLADVNLEYRFNRHLSAEIGYSYDQVDSDVLGGGFTRNRAYVGVTASY